MLLYMEAPPIPNRVADRLSQFVTNISAHEGMAVYVICVWPEDGEWLVEFELVMDDGGIYDRDTVALMPC